MYNYQDAVISENQRNAAGILPHFKLADSAVLGAGAETEAILCKSDVRVWNNCRSAGGAVGPASPRPLGEGSFRVSILVRQGANHSAGHLPPS